MTSTLISVTTTAEPGSPSVGDAYYIPSGATGSNWSGKDDSIGVYTAFGFWAFDDPDRSIIYVVEDEPSSGAAASMLYRSADVFALVANSADIVSADTWFVDTGAHADDENEGTSPHAPKATIQDAVDRASAQGPSAANPHHVVILGADKYTEDLNVPTNVNVWAGRATIAGQILLDDNVTIEIGVHQHAPGVGEDAVDRDAGTGFAQYRARVAAFSGSSTGINNTTSGSRLNVDVGYVEAAAGAPAIGSSSTDGTISLDVGSLALASNSSTGISCANASANIFGRVGTIIDTGFSTTTAIAVSNGTCAISSERVDADTAFNVSGGTLSIDCPSLSGTETFSGGTLNRSIVVPPTAGYVPVGTGTGWEAELAGGILDHTTVTTNTILGASDLVVLCNASSGAITLNLPAASSNSGRTYIVKKIDSSGNRVILDGSSSETIDDSTTYILTSQYDSIQVMCDGTEWWVIG